MKTNPNNHFILPGKMGMPPARRILNAVLVSMTVPFLGASFSFGASQTWDGGSGGTGTDLGTAANWTNDTLPSTNVAADSAIFNNVVTGGLSLIYTGGLPGSAGDKGVNFQLTAIQTGGVTIDGTTSNSIRMGNIAVAGNAGAFSFGNGNSTGGNLILNLGAGTGDDNKLTWTNDSSNAVTINSDVAFTAGSNVNKQITFTGNGDWVVNTNLRTSNAFDIAVIKNGSGALTLGAANTATANGSITLNQGTLNINNATALGTSASTLTIAGGTIDNTSAGAITLSNNNAQNWNGDFAFTGTRDLNLGTGAVTMNASRTVTVNGGNLTVGGAIGGVGFGLTKAGAGTLTLSGNNTYSGGATLNLGTLNINNAAALGATASTFTITGGMIDNTSAAAITLSNNNAQNWNGDFAFTGTKDLNLGTGAVTMNASRTVTVNGRNLTVGGVIGGSGFGLTKKGAGTLTLSGNNTYTGLTTVDNSTTASNNSVVTVSNNQSAATGGWLIGNSNVADVKTTVNFDSTSTIVTAASNFMRIGATASTNQDQTLNVAGSVTNNGTLDVLRTGLVNLNNGGAWTQAGAMNLTAVGGFPANLKVNAGGAFTYTGANVSAATIKMTLGAAGGQSIVTINGTGVFTTAAGFEQTSNVVADNGVRVAFTNGGTLKLSQNVTALSTQVNFNLGTGGGVIDTNGFNTTLSGIVTWGTSSGANLAQRSGIDGGGGLTKKGDGTLTLTGNNTYTGSTTVNSGTLKIDGGSIGTSDVTVTGGILASGTSGTIGKTVTVNSGAKLGAGGVGAVGAATVASNLNFSSGSIFDWDLTTGTGNGTYDSVSVTGTLNITSGAKFNVVSSTAFSDVFWNTPHTWSDIFGGKAIDNFIVSNFLYSGSATAPASEGYFTVGSNSLTWTAVPEPTSALAGLLITAGLLRRRRK